jgi:hypothetical protein
VEEAQEKVQFGKANNFQAKVIFDGKSGTVTVEAGGRSVSAHLKGPARPVTHYGYGGANSETLFSEVRIRTGDE